MLVSMKEILEHANEENYAVPAPVTQTELNARTAIKCAEEMNSPIILLIPLIFDYDVDLFGRMLFGGCKAANFKESLLWFRSDENLAKRRKSWENTWSYIETIRRFHKMGYSSLMDVLVIAGAQTVMYLMPIKVQNWLYKTFLRK